MKMQSTAMKRMVSRNGFTLIEILIVVMVLGILAMIILPQINVSTSDAKESTLSTNLMTLRNAIELYYHQHNNVYPGANASGIDGSSDAAAYFVDQLTYYTDADGKASATKSTTYQYGPYLKASDLPKNPFTETSDLSCDTSTTDITSRTADSTATAWKFYTETGVLIANDGDHTDL